MSLINQLLSSLWRAIEYDYDQSYFTKISLNKTCHGFHHLHLYLPSQLRLGCFRTPCQSKPPKAAPPFTRPRNSRKRRPLLKPGIWALDRVALVWWKKTKLGILKDISLVQLGNLHSPPKKEVTMFGVRCLLETRNHWSPFLGGVFPQHGKEERQTSKRRGWILSFQSNMSSFGNHHSEITCFWDHMSYFSMDVEWKIGLGFFWQKRVSDRSFLGDSVWLVVSGMYSGSSSTRTPMAGS